MDSREERDPFRKEPTYTRAHDAALGAAMTVAIAGLTCPSPFLSLSFAVPSSICMFLWGFCEFWLVWFVLLYFSVRSVIKTVTPVTCVQGFTAMSATCAGVLW